MGCNCRSGRTASRSFAAPAVTSRPVNLCAAIEAEGNSIPVRLGSTGQVYLGAPYSPSAATAASSLIPSLGCRGSFAQAISAAELKLMSVYANPSLKGRFVSQVGGTTLTLGYLREILRAF